MRNRNPRRFPAAGLAAGLLLVAGGKGGQARAASYRLVYPFTTASDASGNFVVAGPTLYGTSRINGTPRTTGGNGEVFHVNTDGTNFGIVHAFQGFPADGDMPHGGVISSGTTLFGTTALGGTQKLGTVYSVSTNGTAEMVLHPFVGGSDGVGPLGPVLLSGSYLYGMTGTSNVAQGAGTIYRVHTDGTGYQQLHVFTGSTVDGGAVDTGGFVQSGNVLYGMTTTGGASGLGTVFQINTDGTGFKLLYSFTGGSTGGASPQAGLVLIGSHLFGTTEAGGPNDHGTVFSLNTDGTDFRILHPFGNFPDDGYHPQGTLVLAGNTLYGTTHDGGSQLAGTLFGVNTDGTGYLDLHNFSFSTIDGADPNDALTLSNGALYGATEFAGPNDDGAIFSYSVPNVPEPTSASLLLLSLVPLRRRRRHITE